MIKEVKLTPADLVEFMKQNAVPGEILYLSLPTPTVEAAAQAVRTKPERIVKSILFLVNGAPVLSISSGLRVIERRAIAQHYNVGRKRVKLADPQTVLQISGYEVGAMPPFGHLEALPTLLDHHVLQHPYVYAGGGAENALVRLNPQDILRVAKAKVIDLHQGSSAEPGHGGSPASPDF
jgi:prolyl-tRNA editing enzyme YbaK/EbsC (Cys-tRNA(Pro) deacylase)